LKFGLIGKSLQHSFSKKYFEEKFNSLNLPHSYQNFELPSINRFNKIIQQNPDLKGLNVTIPYKESVIPFLNELDKDASAIGAVNTIAFENGILKGYNTDFYGFTKSLAPYLKSYHQKALVLGSGGASKAVAYGLKQLGIEILIVSRKPSGKEIDYAKAAELLPETYLVVNTTPLGTFPDIEKEPPLKPEPIQKKHVFYDLIYNPQKTQWLRKAADKGALVINGYKMLVYQAERSWEIWNEV